MLSDLLRWGGKRPGQPDASGETSVPRDGEPVVASKVFPKFLTALGQRPAPPVLLDFGPVIGANVAFFGEQLGCKLFIEDLLTDLDRHTKAGTLAELPAAIGSRFRHGDESVDGVLCWDIFDFLQKPAAQALAKEIVRMIRPGGAMMGFFCTSSVPSSAFMKYEIVDGHSLRHRQHTGVGGPRQAFQNRDIIRMFDGLIVSDSFLLKNNIREILLKRRS